MADSKGLMAVIVVIVLVLIVMQLPQLKQQSTLSQDDPLLARQIPLKTEPAYYPNKLIENNDNINKVASFNKQPLFSIVQYKTPLFTFFNPDINSYCCDNNCDYQCSGSFDYCDAWCNPQTKKSCPSGYVLVNNDQNCCPSSQPYYKAGFCFSEPKVDYPTSTGCPNSICTDGGAVLYQPKGFDPTMNCQNKFGVSPTGIYWVDPNSACCFESGTAYEKASGSGNLGGNTLGILCSYKSTAGIPCSQNGATATCNVNNECSVNTFQCLDNIRYQSCALVGGIPLQGVQISQYYKLSSISACAVGQLCENSQCIGDLDKDGVSDTKDKCPNTPIAQKVDEFGCIPTCKVDEVKLVDGSCKQVVQTCIDNNLNNICDLDDPIVWADPTNNVPICADRNGDRICDGVEGLFCKDSNNNKICDSDEIKWLSTYCLDENGNGICDGIETIKAVCDKTILPVCDLDTNITYPNLCFANAYNVVNRADGSCKVAPVIIRRDCASGDIPIPSGYVCDFETGWLFRREYIYQNITIDCRGKQLKDYICIQVGEDWIWTRKELVEIDCYSRGCPKPNQLCQGGICVEIPKRCPTEIDCNAIYGTDSTCDEEIGLCTKIQFKPVQPTPPETKGFFASIPTSVKIIGGIIIGFIILMRFL